MSALIGIDWPVNSVGVLPDVDPTRPGYLLPRGGDKTTARAALVNARVWFLLASFINKSYSMLSLGYFRTVSRKEW